MENFLDRSSASATPCRFFLQGFCKNGSGCRFSHDPSFLPPPTHAVVNNQGAVPSCNLCGKMGHWERDCWASHVCVRCGKQGHLEEDCKTCLKCGKVGHFARDCTYIKCKRCGKGGHYARDCTYIECKICGKPGHVAADCRNVVCDRDDFSPFDPPFFALTFLTLTSTNP